MDIRITVNENKSCNPSDLILGNENEKNIDKIVLDIDTKLPYLNWYLLYDSVVYAFNNKKELMIDDRLTNTPGTHTAYIIGSNAKPGKAINSGTMFFGSNKIIMRVRERG